MHFASRTGSTDEGRVGRAGTVPDREIATLSGLPLTGTATRIEAEVAAGLPFRLGVRTGASTGPEPDAALSWHSRFVQTGSMAFGPVSPA